MYCCCMNSFWHIPQSSFHSDRCTFVDQWSFPCTNLWHHSSSNIRLWFQNDEGFQNVGFEHLTPTHCWPPAKKISSTKAGLLYQINAPTCTHATNAALYNDRLRNNLLRYKLTLTSSCAKNHSAKNLFIDASTECSLNRWKGLYELIHASVYTPTVGFAMSQSSHGRFYL